MHKNSDMGATENLLHFERSALYCQPYADIAKRWTAEARKEGSPGWVAASVFADECIETMRRAMEGQGPEAAFLIQLKHFNPGMGAFFRLLIREGMMRAEQPHSLHYLVIEEEFNQFLSWFTKLVSNKQHLEAGFKTVLIHHTHVVSFELAGKKLFQVSKGLADQLIHTELRGLYCDDLQLPFESIYIEVPPELGFKVWNAETEWHDVEGVYLIDDPIVPQKTAFVPVKADEQVRGWRIMIVGKSKNPNDPQDDALFYYTVPLPEGQTLEHQLDWLATEADRNADAKPMKDEERRIFRWIMNVILYATMADAEQETWMPNKEARQLKERINKLPGKSKKKDKLKDQLKRMNARTVILLGRSVPYEKEAPSGEKRELTVMTRVIGHFRRYHVGQGRAQTVRKWIRPFWRGPEDAAISNPTHLLKGPQSAPPTHPQEEQVPLPSHPDRQE